MHKIVSKIVIFCNLSLIFISDATAGNFYIMHINGLGMSQSDAQNNLNALNSVTIDSRRFYWRLLWNDNTSATKTLDLLKQKNTEEHINQSFADYTQEQMRQQKLDYPLGSPEYIQFQDLLRPSYQQGLIKFGGKNLSNLINQYLELIPYRNGHDYATNDSDCVLLIAHSQGNLYANGLYNYLLASKFNNLQISLFGFGSVNNQELGSIVSASNFLADTGQNYLTSTNDRQIATLRKIYPHTLAGNIAIPFSNQDRSGHDLINIYLAHSEAQQRLNDYVNQFYKINTICH